MLAKISYIFIPLTWFFFLAVQGETRTGSNKRLIVFVIIFLSATLLASLFMALKTIEIMRKKRKRKKRDEENFLI
jgi:hypothetical protein